MSQLVKYAWGLAILILLLFLSVFVVDQRQYAIVQQFGEVKRVMLQPGLYLKIPILQHSRFFDRRIMTLDAREPQRFITSEKKNVLVDSFVKWQIIDPQQYFITVNGDEGLAQTRISQTVNAGLREEFGKRTVHEVVSGEREKIMEEMRGKADADLRSIGVRIIDVRIKRVEYPQEASDAVYRRMEAERKRVANELRSTGYAESEKIRADADRQKEIIVAEAYRDAQKIKGQGDATAAQIYAAAFTKNPEFYAFYRSMDAYKNSFRNKNDILVIDSSSDFFKYLRRASSK